MIDVIFHAGYKGKAIFGYTWDVNKLNDGTGVYRITFSFDGIEAGSTLNTFFTSSTGIVLAAEEIVPEAEGAGGTAIIDVADNLTYIDVTITGRGKGGGRK
ncbi:MAG TPA: hypothetical protein VIL78_11360 [Hanamia sp.]